jgi:molybdate transport system permease protein
MGLQHITTKISQRSRLANQSTGALSIVVLLFLTAPIILVIVQGISYLIPCMLDEEMRFAIRLSLTTSIISTVICLALSLPTSIGLYRMNGLRRKVVEGLFYIPMSLPHLVTGIALLLLYGRHGMGQFLFDHFGIDFVYTKYGIVMAQLFVNLPFSIKTIMQSLDEVDQKQIFVSRTLGCSEWKSFRYIVIPQIRGGIFTSAIMNWARAIGEFGAVMMLAGTTRLRTEVIPTAIFLNMATGDIGLALGLATILIFISVMSIVVYHLFSQNKENSFD